MLAVFLFLAVGLVAYTNGANANFKGAASLYGSGMTTLRGALWWATATTLLGSLCALLLAEGMLKKFGGRGLVPDALAQTPDFLFAVALGAGLTSLLATKLGFPVSTTHALVGALAGAGYAGSGTEVKLSALGKSFLFPLFFSPVVAVVLGALMYGLLKKVRLAPDHRTKPLDLCHYASAGAACFARGLNDTPKMVALLLILPAWDVRWGTVTVALAMALGAMLDADKVAETLGKKVTDMNPGQGFAASLATAALVTTASLHSLPLSTTHVSVGALVGIGTVTRQTHWRKAGEILLAWVITLPCGAASAAVTYAVVKSLG